MHRVCLLLATTMLSGCSWMGGIGSNGAGSTSEFGGGRYHANGADFASASKRCQVQSQSQPIPAGCDPSQVTLAVPTGRQGTQYVSNGEFVSGGYGSHAGQATQHAATQKPGQGVVKHKRKPFLRGTFALGFEKSVSGDLVDYDDFTPNNPTTNYNPDDFLEGFSQGSPASGQRTTTTTTANIERVDRPIVNFDDAHSTPLNVKAGLEFIATPHTTFFANAGYTYAEGEDDTANTVVQGSLVRSVTTEDFDTTTGAPIGGLQIASVIIPNREIATFSYDFTSLERVNFEGGIRHYFKPLWNSESHQSVTPFISASGGISHYNALSYDVNQTQVFYGEDFDNNNGNSFNVVPSQFGTVDVYDAQWVLQGALQAGIDWQVTPKTALALETGLRFEQGRDYSSAGDAAVAGTPIGKTGDNYSIPVTIRASYNF